jgi:hypothetical protein
VEHHKGVQIRRAQTADHSPPASRCG